MGTSRQTFPSLQQGNQRFSSLTQSSNPVHIELLGTKIKGRKEDSILPDQVIPRLTLPFQLPSVPHLPRLIALNRLACVLFRHESKYVQEHKHARSWHVGRCVCGGSTRY